MDENGYKMLLVLKCLDIQTHIFSALPPSFFHQGVNGYFLFEADNSLLKILDFNLYIRIGIMIDQKCY